MKGNRAKKRSAPNLIIVIALLVSILTVIGVALFFLFTRHSATPVKQALPEVTKPATIDVLVSTQNIDEGIELKAGLFRKETRPASDFVGVGVVSDFGQLSGAYAKSFVAAGQPLLAEHLTFRAPVNSVVPQIRVGYRAITIKLDKQTTNEGWARAGVRVDVLWASKQGTNSQAVIIAQNLRVLSSGASVSSEFGGESRMIQNSESTVTLEVSAEDQKRLKLAAGKGEMRLLLRGDDDTGENTERAGISVDQVINGSIDNSKSTQAEQGWVVIDGRKYRVVGNMLVPG
jgi:pilus assembly protein CpaB